jgi:hypothetical protein
MARRRAASPEPSAATVEVGPQQPINISPKDVVFPASGVPEIVVDGIAGMSVINGVARLNLFSVQQIGANEQRPTVVLRLAISVPTLINIQRGLTTVVSAMERAGVAPETAA